jgi:uncharacterized low-complexity protein
VIRRAFWLGAGAAAGIMGYRRVEAIGRQVSGKVTGTVTGAGIGKSGAGKSGAGKSGAGKSGAGKSGVGKPVLKRSAGGATRRATRGALRLARESMRFTRDVREGMDLYMARHNAPRASTLNTRELSTRELSTRELSTRTRTVNTDDKDGR